MTDELIVGDRVTWMHKGEIRTGTVVNVAPVWGDWLTVLVDGSKRINRVHKPRLSRIEQEASA